jgi:hypothetical protein
LQQECEQIRIAVDDPSWKSAIDAGVIDD